MEVSVCGSGPDWCLDVPYACSLSLLGKAGVFVKRMFCSSSCLAAHAIMNVLHDQNPGISVNKILGIHLLTNLNTAVRYKLGDFQFLVYVWGRCFNFFSFKPVGLFSAFSVLKVDLCLPFYSRNLCYFWCKTRVSKCPCFLLRIFLSFHLPKAALVQCDP